MRQLLLDNGSLYTDKLYSLLVSMGKEPERLLPKDLDTQNLGIYDSFVLSGRRVNDKQTNATNSKVISHAIKNSTPLLGVCYGAEIIALACGGAIRKMSNPRQGLYDVEPKTNSEICSKPIKVYESHHYEISTLSDKLVCIASSKQCANEIIRVVGAPIYGTQFHPEMSDDGHGLVADFWKCYIAPKTT